MADSHTRGRQAAFSVRAMATFLDGWAWSQFATLTFDARWSDPAGPKADSAFSICRNWIEALPHHPGFYLCIERGSFGRTHGHALLGFGAGGVEVSNRDIGERWRLGRDQIRTFDRERGTRHYLTKYIHKSPDVWDTGGNLRLLRGAVHEAPELYDDLLALSTKSAPLSFRVHDGSTSEVKRLRKAEARSRFL